MHTKHTQKVIGSNLQIFSELDSTNNYAMQCIHDGKAEPGLAILALCQTNGKGQRGKQWHTGKNQNLALSLVIESDFIDYKKLFWLQMFASVSVCAAINQYVDGCKVKWPNDIFYKNKKLGGILIENVWQGKNLSYSVIGIGLNINENIDQKKLANAISLTQITNKEYDIIEVAQLIINNLNSNWLGLKNFDTNLYEDYLAFLYKKNESIILKQQESIIETIVQTVNINGQMVCGLNKELVYNHGDVEWIFE